MPYDVDGWIKIVWDFSVERENKEWSGVINLNRFCLCGDNIADKLFGLTKHPCDNPYFAKRGVPKDCCEYIAEAVKRNEKFIEQYGEGAYDHTWALWSEIEPLLDDLESYNI